MYVLCVCVCVCVCVFVLPPLEESNANQPGKKATVTQAQGLIDCVCCTEMGQVPAQHRARGWLLWRDFMQRFQFRKAQEQCFRKPQEQCFTVGRRKNSGGRNHNIVTYYPHYETVLPVVPEGSLLILSKRGIDLLQKRH